MRLTFLAALAVLTFVGTAYAAATDADLEHLAAQIHADELAFEQVREDLDAEVRAYTRPLFRDLMDGLDAQVNSQREHEAVAFVRSVLAAPGPAPSVAKHLHTVTRQAGAEGILALRRTQARVLDLVE